MDEAKRIQLLKLGFFPVTVDFWHGAKQWFPKTEDYTRFDWARMLPDGTFLPYSEGYLEKVPLDELCTRAQAYNASVFNRIR